MQILLRNLMKDCGDAVQGCGCACCCATWLRKKGADWMRIGCCAFERISTRDMMANFSMDGQIEKRHVGTIKEETGREPIIQEDTRAAGDGRNLLIKF